MLLDEPLSALDLKLRQHMRAELRAIQKRTNVTFIYITHDQGEALAMSDRVGVMSQGVLQQVAVPQEIYNNPANGFVASFVGENNIFPGRVIAATNGVGRIETAFGTFNARLGPGIAQGAIGQALRPAGALGPGARSRDSETNALPVEIADVAFEGNFINVHARGESGRRLHGAGRATTAGEPVPDVGQQAAPDLRTPSTASCWPTSRRRRA